MSDNWDEVIASVHSPPIRNLAYRIKRWCELRGSALSPGLRASARLKGKHEGQRVFLGNGPSLEACDLELIKNEISFGFNKIHLIFPQTEWRPTYYFIQDLYVLAQCKESLLDWKPYGLTVTDKYSPRLPGAYRYIEHAIKSLDTLYFRPDPVRGFYSFGTVVYTAIQMAVFMGIKEMYLVGIDCDYRTPEQYRSYETPKDRIYKSRGERTHFHPDYYAEGTDWIMADVEKQYEAFRYVASLMGMLGISIFNSTRGGDWTFSRGLSWRTR